MLLVANRDFTCRPTAGFYLCTGTTSQVIHLFAHTRKVIGDCVRAISASRGMAPPAELPPSFGPSLVAATQTVLAVLNRSVPLPDVLKPVLSQQASDADLVNRTAERAPLIIDYIARTLALKPTALAVPPSTMHLGGGKLSRGTILAASAGLAATTGFVFLAYKMRRRMSGKEDASHLLPDDDEYDESDAIDVEAVEVTE